MMAVGLNVFNFFFQPVKLLIFNSSTSLRSCCKLLSDCLRPLSWSWRSLELQQSGEHWSKWCFNRACVRMQRNHVLIRMWSGWDTPAYDLSHGKGGRTVRLRVFKTKIHFKVFKRLLLSYTTINFSVLLKCIINIHMSKCKTEEEQAFMCPTFFTWLYLQAHTGIQRWSLNTRQCSLYNFVCFSVGMSS